MSHIPHPRFLRLRKKENVQISLRRRSMIRRSILMVVSGVFTVGLVSIAGAQSQTPAPIPKSTPIQTSPVQTRTEMPRTPEIPRTEIPSATPSQDVAAPAKDIPMASSGGKTPDIEHEESECDVRTVKCSRLCDPLPREWKSYSGCLRIKC